MAKILKWKVTRYAKEGGKDHQGKEEVAMCEFVNTTGIPQGDIETVYFNGDKGRYEMFYWEEEGA